MRWYSSLDNVDKLGSVMSRARGRDPSAMRRVRDSVHLSLHFHPEVSGSSAFFAESNSLFDDRLHYCIDGATDTQSKERVG